MTNKYNHDLFEQLDNDLELIAHIRKIFSLHGGQGHQVASATGREAIDHRLLESDTCEAITAAGFQWIDPHEECYTDPQDVAAASHNRPYIEKDGMMLPLPRAFQHKAQRIDE